MIELLYHWDAFRLFNYSIFLCCFYESKIANHIPLFIIVFNQRRHILWVNGQYSDVIEPLIYWYFKLRYEFNHLKLLCSSNHKFNYPSSWLQSIKFIPLLIKSDAKSAYSILIYYFIHYYKPNANIQNSSKLQKIQLAKTIIQKDISNGIKNISNELNNDQNIPKSILNIHDAHNSPFFLFWLYHDHCWLQYSLVFILG